jgi:protein-tyrosine-phosphatase
MRKPPAPAKILFICIGNACRSPMAEALANFHSQGRVEAHSAGMYPYGRLVDETYDVMQEKGIPIDGQCSKGLQDVELMQMHTVVRMGKEVAFVAPKEFKGRVLDWDIPDPYARGIETFRSVRDLIEQRVLGLLWALESMPSPGGGVRS